MADPTGYTRYRDFSQFQSDNPNTDLVGSDLDTDFDRIKTSVDSLVSSVKDVRRSDGAVANSSIGTDQLKGEVVALLNGVNPRGDWVTATAYAKLDLVKDSNVLYLCLVAHTSGTFATDLAAAKWMAISPATSGANVGNTPAGNIASTDVQSAINELDTEKQPLDATLTTIAALTGAADKMIYFTGADVAALTGLTAAARTLLADADAPTMLTTLGALALAGGTMTGELTLFENPTTDLMAATKSYVDSSVALAASNGFKNRLINGDFAIDQRNEGASQTFTAAAAVAYTVDRWYASCTGSNITGQRVAGTSPNQYAYKFTGAAANTGLIFGQRIESANVADLVSSSVTVSLKAKSSSITSLTWTAYYANAADDFSAKTQIATGTLVIGAALLSVNFTFGTGANAVNGIAIEFSCGALLAAQTLQFENVQLESGTSASLFERRAFGERIKDCQRYYFKTYDLGTALATATAAGMAGFVAEVGGSVFTQPTYLPVAMRAAPTLVNTWDGAGTANKASYRLNGGALSNNLTAPTFDTASTKTILWYQSVNNAGIIFHYAVSAEL